MKVKLIIIVSFIIVLATYSDIIAQKSPIFRGIINFEMEAHGNLSDAEKSQIEGTVVSTYGDGVYKTETKTSMMSQTQIFYADSIITMTEVMGQQFAFRMTTEEAKTMQPPKNDNPPDVNFINETKEIAGYVCHKAEIALNDDIIEIFYSKDFSLSNFMVEDNFKKLDGLISAFLRRRESGLRCM